MKRKSILKNRNSPNISTNDDSVSERSLKLKDNAFKKKKVNFCLGGKIEDIDSIERGLKRNVFKPKIISLFNVNNQNNGAHLNLQKKRARTTKILPNVSIFDNYIKGKDRQVE